MATAKDIVIGIDLGTTYSCVSFCEKGRHEVYANENGHRTTPSYVAFTPMERLVGNVAKDQISDDPANTVFDAKRMIGRKFDDPHITENIAKNNWPFKVLNMSGYPCIEVTYLNKAQQFLPEQISAIVLEKMKELAEQYTGVENIKKAVITVPANFDDSQRKATINAAEIAGLKVLRLLNEPTAAAIAYGYNKRGNEKKNVLIYDLGGGTFDVCVLQIYGGVFDVLATRGNTHLGGEDFDNRMVDHFIEEFNRKYSIDLSNNKTAKYKLRSECEKAKRVLSSRYEARVELASLADAIDFKSSITRARFEELCDDLFEGTLDTVKEALNHAAMKLPSIDEVVLVGGSTKIPKVRQILQKFFVNKKLNYTADADLAVATGAAIYAASIIGDKEEAMNGITLKDATPLSYGTDAEGGLMEVIIPRNTKYPVKGTALFKNAHDDQTELLVQVLQGEFEFVDKNQLLGEFELKIPPKPRGTCEINISFEVNANGFLIVSATELSTGVEQQIEVTDLMQRFSNEEIEEMIAEAERQKMNDLKNKARVVAKNALHSFCFDLRKSLNANNTFPNASSQQKIALKQKVAETLYWIDAHPDASHEQIKEKTKQISTERDALRN